MVFNQETDNPNITPIQPKGFTDLSRGLITESAVSFLIQPQSSVQEVINFNFDQIGSATVRSGITLLGSTFSSVNNQGLFEYRDANGVNNWLIAFNNGTANRLASGSWTSISGGTFHATNKVRMTQFLNFLWVVDGSNAVQIWNGTAAGTFVTTGNALSGPSGCSLIENFRSRVWIGNNSSYPSRVFFSSLPSAAATPVITWNTDPVTGNWIDLAPQDGEQLTGLKRTADALLAFKTNHIYQIYSINQTQPDPTINVGTYSAESIVEAKDGVYFHHSSGFYRYRGGQVTEISRPIVDIVKTILSSQYASITGWLEADGDHVAWSIGNVTYRRKTYNNFVVRFTISTQVWTTYQYPNPFVAGSKYNDGTNLFAVAADNLGNIFELNNGKNDNTTPISCSLVHTINTFDNSLATTTHIEKMMLAHTNLAGFKVQWATTEDLVNDWSKVVGQRGGVLTKYDSFINNANVKGRGILFRIAGSWNGNAIIPGSYNGYEIIKAWSSLERYPS